MTLINEDENKKHDQKGAITLSNYEHFKQEMFELLCIQAPSGFEEPVRQYLIPKLVYLVDRFHIDEAGNILAEKVCGTGDGAVVILSAHMDSFNNIEPTREVLEADEMFFTTKGVLGADDRAGIAVIMNVLRNIDDTSFNGTLKISFSTSEEKGCIGAKKIDKKWYENVNLAIIVDRRNSRDIVTGSGTPYNFCCEQVGEFFENCSAILDMDYRVVGGGYSDAAIFSAEGINSVNLSAGYYHEHTEKEYVKVKETYDTLKLVMQSLVLINDFVHTFGEVPKIDYSKYYENYYINKKEKYYDWYEEKEDYDFSETIWKEYGNYGGTVTLSRYPLQGVIEIYQSGQYFEKYVSESLAIEMHESDFAEMVDAYLGDQGLPNVEALKSMFDEWKTFKQSGHKRKGVNLKK